MGDLRVRKWGADQPKVKGGPRILSDVPTFAPVTKTGGVCHLFVYARTEETLVFTPGPPFPSFPSTPCRYKTDPFAMVVNGYLQPNLFIRERTLPEI